MITITVGNFKSLIGFSGIALEIPGSLSRSITLICIPWICSNLHIQSLIFSGMLAVLGASDYEWGPVSASRSKSEARQKYHWASPWCCSRQVHPSRHCHHSRVCNINLLYCSINNRRDIRSDYSLYTTANIF